MCVGAVVLQPVHCIPKLTQRFEDVLLAQLLECFFRLELLRLLRIIPRCIGFIINLV